MSSQNTPFEKCREILTVNQTYGAWSLIVTFFGDMAQSTNDPISGYVLTNLCELLGIKSQAMRVALHRLRKDGWIDSVKTGRRSAYFLTPSSRAETKVASSRIYAAHLPRVAGMQTVIFPKKDHVLPSDGSLVKVNAQTAIGLTEHVRLPKDAIVSETLSEIPKWAQRLFCPTELEAKYKDFSDRLNQITPLITAEYSALQRTALRILIVHGWRRLILKHGDFPEKFFPNSCPAGDCHMKMSRFLSILERTTLEALEEGTLV